MAQNVGKHRKFGRPALKVRAVAVTAVLAAGAFAVFAATDQGVAPGPAATPDAPLVKRLSPTELVEIAPMDLREVLPISGEVTALRQVTIS
ncbi:MAG TPA: hypothetical protein VGC31_07310, partial [Paenirhodobacter sp.]